MSLVKYGSLSTVWLRQLKHVTWVVLHEECSESHKCDGSNTMVLCVFKRLSFWVPSKTTCLGSQNIKLWPDEIAQPHNWCRWLVRGDRYPDEAS